MSFRASEYLIHLTSALLDAGVNDPSSVAKMILCGVLDKKISEILTGECELTDTQQQKVEEIARSVAEKGIPVQYAIGKASFRYIDLLVDERVLIPRPESEMIVDIVKFFLKENDIQEPLLADIGTGSGAIAISLALEVESSHVFATDVSSDAIDVATVNASLCQASKSITFEVCTSLDAFEYYQHGKNTFDCIVSNPPYIPQKVYDRLPNNVKDFEPKGALLGGEDGLDVFREILNKTRWLISDGGLFVFELFEDSLDSAKKIAQTSDLKDVSIIKDLAGKDRFLVARG